MSDDSMSHSQVESLLRVMQSGAHASAAEAAEAGSAAPNCAEHSSPAQSRAAVTAVPYDFRHRQRISSEQLQRLRSVHETLAHQFGGGASSLLRCVVQCELLQITQKTYGEFITSLENPSCLQLLSIDPQAASWLLDVTPVLAFAVVDRLLGGDAEPGFALRRELTAIEHRLLRRWTNLFLAEATRAWQPLAAIELAFDRDESDPQLALVVPPADAVVAIALDVKVGRCRGQMHLCIPVASLASLDCWSSSDSTVPSSETQPSAIHRQAIAGTIDQASVELAVTLAKSKIRTVELLGLAVGDVITTEQEVTEPLELSIQGTPKFLARPGAYRGRKAICIQGLIQP